MRYKLEEVCHFINGGSWSINEYAEIGFPVLKVSNFQKDSFSLSDISFLKKESSKKYQKNKLQLHDLVVATVGSHPNLVNSSAGRTVSVSKAIEGYFLNQNAVCLRTKDNKILDQRYLTYLGKTDYFQHFIQQRGKGAANQMRIPIGGIKAFEFELPTVKIQKKIASTLSAYDDLIENNLRRIKLLEEQAQLMYEEWFVRMQFPDFEKVGIDEETGLPVGWETISLGSLVSLVKNTILPKDLDAELPYIGLEHIPRKSITLSEWETSKKVDSLKIQFKKYDILFGKIRPYFHKVGVAFVDGIASTDTIILRPLNSQHHGLVLQTVFSEHFVDSATQSSNGTKMPRANWKILKEFPVVLPSKPLLEQYEKFSVENIQLIEKLLFQNRLLQEARDIMLPRLMMGMVDVNNI